MTRPAVGLKAFHDGAPFEFLYLVGRGLSSETWRVRPIFVAPAPERDLVVRQHDRITPIHGQ